MCGALEGVQGILLRKKNLCRLVLSVDMLAQSVAVEVNAWDVEPCGKGSADNGIQHSAGSADQSRLLNVSSARTAVY